MSEKFGKILLFPKDKLNFNEDTLQINEIQYNYCLSIKEFINQLTVIFNESFISNIKVIENIIDIIFDSNNHFQIKIEKK